MIKGRLIPELFALKNLLYTTARIETYDANGNFEGVGTSFFYHIDIMDENEQPGRIEILVTNKHVIKNAATGWITFHLEPVVDGFSSGDVYDLEIHDFEQQFVLHPDPEVDLCGMVISKHLRKIKEETGQHVYYQAFSSNHISTDEELKKMFPIEDVYMVGYPDGLWDEDNNLPITRKGATASHPAIDFNRKSVGAVDIATFKGSSGSPIILYQSGPPRYDSGPSIIFYLLGVLKTAAWINHEGDIDKTDVLTKESQLPGSQMIHLGYYVKAKELYELENEIIK